MDQWTIYYNPRCGTCQKALARLKAKKIEPEVVEYLKTPPPADELQKLLDLIGPETLVRSKEPVYEELGLAKKKLSNSAWAKIIHDNPVLLQRPVVVRNGKAVVARPPELLDALFK